MKSLFLSGILFLSLQCVQGKVFQRKIQTIDVERSYSYNDRWPTIAKTEKEAISALIDLLEQSKTGKKVLSLSRKRASQYGKPLESLIEGGEGSITDTTLVRKFSPSNPHAIQYESRSKVILNRNNTVKNGVLDLAHELIHFALREPFNPYQPPFGLQDFIVSTVEGKGGEVEAYLIECQVLGELFGHHGQSNCERVIDPATGRVNKSRGVFEFYQLGHHHHNFEKSLKKHNIRPKDFSSSSSGQAYFISSAYGLPYPLAAIHEYESIMERVCVNDSKRLALMKRNLGRQPAQGSGLSSAYQDLTSLHRQRCEDFL